MSMTCAMTLGLTISSIIHSDKFDLTAFAPYIYVLSFASGATGIMILASKSIDTETVAPLDFGIQFVYCLIGVVFFSWFLMFDT